MSKGQFPFPSYYDMPPFFTIQPVLNTRKKQMQMWLDMILEWSKFYKKNEFDVNELSKSPLFNNTKINRKLSIEGIRSVLEDLVGQGNGEWLNKEKSRLLVYYRRPEEWGEMVYKWVSENGKLNSVLTVFEIQQGEDTEKAEFHGLETRVLLKALKSLEKDGRCQVFTGTSEDNLGVKFFSV